MDKKSTPTPGGWVAKQKLDHVTQAGGWVILYPAQPGAMCRLDHAGEFSEVNAHLLAAAPELLAAARIALECLEGQECETAKVPLLRAIAKAEGR